MSVSLSSYTETTSEAEESSQRLGTMCSRTMRLQPSKQIRYSTHKGLLYCSFWLKHIHYEQIDVAVNAPEAGTIKEFLVNEEDTVTVGQDLVKMELGESPQGGHVEQGYSETKAPASTSQSTSSDPEPKHGQEQTNQERSSMPSQAIESGTTPEKPARSLPYQQQQEAPSSPSSGQYYKSSRKPRKEGSESIEGIDDGPFGGRGERRVRASRTLNGELTD